MTGHFVKLAQQAEMLARIDAAIDAEAKYWAAEYDLLMCRICGGD